ncbi:MAG: histidine--tRNA ligase [Bacteroidia bacterium]
MAVQKPTLPKGTRDFGPADVQKRKYILNTIETVFKKYGFMPLETPTMENLSTLEGKYGEEGDKLLFRILDSGDYLKSLKEHNDKILADESQDATFAPSFSGKLIDLDAKAATKFIAEKGLRYDLTVPFARYVVMHRNEITFPFKRYQMQPVWRADRPQKGRYREFWQCDADVVGSDSLLNELDLIQIYDEAFRLIGIPIEIKINNRKILQGIVEAANATDKLIEFSTTLDKIDKIGFDGVITEWRNAGFTDSQIDLFRDFLYAQRALPVQEYDQFVSDIEKTISFMRNGVSEAIKLNSNYILGVNELDQIIKNLLLINPKVNLKIDLSLARGLSYYTGAIFEVVATQGSLKSSIGGGGRYDNLTGIFGLPNVSGVGISFGLDRIYDVIEELKLFPEQLRATSTQILFCHFDEATQLYCLPALKALRDAGIAAEVFPDNKKLGKQLDYANALQIPFAAIAGETEMQQQVFTVRNLITGEQQTCTVQALISLLGQ